MNDDNDGVVKCQKNSTTPPRCHSDQVDPLVIIVLEALSRDFRVGVPWELFFADDLVIIATSIEECVARVEAWKKGMESKGLRVNMGKTKVMASGVDLDVLQDSGKFPCGVCRTGVGASSMLCVGCKHSRSTRNALVLKLSLRTRHISAPAGAGTLVCDQ